MNNRKTFFTLAMILGCAILLGLAAPIQAHHRPGHGAGPSGSELSAKFCLLLEDLEPGLAPDILDDLNTADIIEGLYCDSKQEKVLVFTGSGPGFRFDTNKSQQIPLRTVWINFPGGSVDIKDNDGIVLDTLFSDQYDIDLRFSLYDQEASLDLGAMIVGQVDYVAIDMSFTELGGTSKYGLSWGETNTPFSHGYLVDNPCIANPANGLKAQVERLSFGAWRIRSNPANSNACLWFINDASLDGNQDGTVVSMPFDFIITIK